MSLQPRFANFGIAFGPARAGASTILWPRSKLKEAAPPCMPTSHGPNGWSLGQEHVLGISCPHAQGRGHRKALYLQGVEILLQ